MTEKKPSDFTLLIEDECLAAWMTINNVFAFQQTGWEYWNGVLIQLGAYTNRNEQPMQLLKQFRIMGPNGTTLKTISRSDFQNKKICINIVCNRGTRFKPLPDPDYLQKIFFDPPKSLHRFFQPDSGGILFWQDPENGFVLEARRRTRHNRFNFMANKGDNFTLEVYSGLPEDPETLVNAEALLVEIDDSGGDHGDHKSPPVRSGNGN